MVSYTKSDKRPRLEGILTELKVKKAYPAGKRLRPTVKHGPAPMKESTFGGMGPLIWDAAVGRIAIMRTSTSPPPRACVGPCWHS